MDLLISFDAHAIDDQKDEVIEAYIGFYEDLGKLSLHISHPYNNEKMPRSTCFLENIYVENLESFREKLLEKAKSNKLKVKKLCLMKVEKENYDYKLGT